MIHKAKLLRNHILATDDVNHGILHCCGLDVLDSNGFENVLSSVDVNSPFVIVSEGLLLYFDNEELSRFLGNIALILDTFPQAVWISDIVTKQNLKDLIGAHPGVANAVRQVFAMTGRSVIISNPFESDECVMESFNRHGLTVRSQRTLHDVAELACGTISTGQKSNRADIVGHRKVWVLASK